MLREQVARGLPASVTQAAQVRHGATTRLPTGKRSGYPEEGIAMIRDVAKSTQPTTSVGRRLHPSRKVLLVDPNSRDLEYYRSVLLGQGHAVRASASYSEGTILLNRDTFDLII